MLPYGVGTQAPRFSNTLITRTADGHAWDAANHIPVTARRARGAAIRTVACGGLGRPPRPHKWAGTAPAQRGGGGGHIRSAIPASAAAAFSSAAPTPSWAAAVPALPFTPHGIGSPRASVAKLTERLGALQWSSLPALLASPIARPEPPPGVYAVLTRFLTSQKCWRRVECIANHFPCAMQCFVVTPFVDASGRLDGPAAADHASATPRTRVA